MSAGNLGAGLVGRLGASGPLQLRFAARLYEINIWGMRGCGLGVTGPLPTLHLPILR